MNENPNPALWRASNGLQSINLAEVMATGALIKDGKTIGVVVLFKGNERAFDIELDKDNRTSFLNALEIFHSKR